MAAPWATHVMGSTRSNDSGSLPANFSPTKRRISGILLVPPTRRTLSMSRGRSPRNFIASSMAVPDLTTRGMMISSRPSPRSISSSRDRCRSGTSSALRATAVFSVDSSILAFSTARKNCWLIGRVEDVEAGLLLEAVGQHFAQGSVDVVAAELANALAADFLEDAVMDAQHGDVQGAAAEVVDEDGLIVLGVETVGDGGGGWLVDEGEHLEAGGAGAKLGGVAGQALAVGRDGDDAPW